MKRIGLFSSLLTLLLLCNSACGGGDSTPAETAPPGDVAAGSGGAGGEAGGAGAGEAGSGGTTAPVVLPPLPDVDGIPALVDHNDAPDIVEVNLVAKPSSLQLVPGRKTDLLTYNDQLPGPLLHARVGDRVIVHFENQLDEPTIVHWHGLRISDDMDGSPRLQKPMQPGETFTYDFVVPDAGTFWYHTHVNQIEQLEKGLYGALVVHEREPLAFNREQIFVADDIRLDAANQVDSFLTSGPDIGRGRIGNTILLNGQRIPYKTTIARGAVERWRVVLSSNALSFGLQIQGAKARVIATDGGLLPEPIPLERVEIAPGQRYELEVQADEDATKVSLQAMIWVLDENDEVVEAPFSLVVADVEGEAAAKVPTYPSVTLPATNVDAAIVDWKLSGAVVNGKVQFTINGEAGSADGEHNHTVINTFERGVPVKLRVQSEVSPEHPFHLHGQFFQILERGGKPVTDEPGLRDTVLVRGAESVTVLSYFENPGQWMIHCHISEHSENGMMADVLVVDPSAGSAGASGHDHAGH